MFYMVCIGLYKFEVKKVRDMLLVMGWCLIVDVVCIELGNIGFKIMIYKYLKELYEESGGELGCVCLISEVLYDFVECFVF